MGLTSKITSKIASKLVKPGTRTVRVEHGIKITRFEKTGTEVVHLGNGIKAVKPGENTKLGKMGIECIHSYKPNSIIPSNKTLYSVLAKGAEKPMGLMTSKEMKSWLELIDGLQQAAKQAANPVVKAINKIAGK